MFVGEKAIFESFLSDNILLAVPAHKEKQAYQTYFVTQTKRRNIILYGYSDLFRYLKKKRKEDFIPYMSMCMIPARISIYS